MTAPRHLSLPVVLVALCLLVAGLAASPAGAATYSGHLDLKGPGSLYTSGPGTEVAVAVKSTSGTATYALRVVNTGYEVTQFNLRIPQVYGTANLYSGSLLLTPMSSGPDGYWTAPIAPGKYQALVLKVTTPSSYPPSQPTTVELRSANGTLLETDTVATQVASPPYGYGPTVFAHQGSQPVVGGPVATDEIASSPALSGGQSTTFKVTLTNYGPTPEPLGATLAPTYPSCLAVTVKDGTTDVTQRVLYLGTYRTPVLAANASRSLTVTVKRAQATPQCKGYTLMSLRTFVDDATRPPDALLLEVPFGPA